MAAPDSLPGSSSFRREKSVRLEKYLSHDLASLCFMHREFKGHCLSLDKAIDSREVQLLFEDSWYWLHYRFFNCRDAVCRRPIRWPAQIGHLLLEHRQKAIAHDAAKPRLITDPTQP